MFFKQVLDEGWLCYKYVSAIIIIIIVSITEEEIADTSALNNHWHWLE